MLITVATAIGLSLIMYSSMATWFYQLDQSKVVSRYVQDTTDVPQAVREDLILQAQQFNKTLPPGPFQDPYTVTGDTDRKAAQAATDKYNSMLTSGTSTVMARLRIPAINVDLPIYHGTSASVLAVGVGHLPASSLPVGGPGTHAVLIGHTGLANAPLFTDLNKLVVGDQFMIDVYGETLYYQVDQRLVVLPDDMSALQIFPGMDYVTLLTCIPKWVNTFRLLVRGVRIPAPPLDNPVASLTSQVQTAPSPGIPWWAAVILIGTIGAALISVFCLKPKRILLPAARRFEPDPNDGDTMTEASHGQAWADEPDGQVYFDPRRAVYELPDLRASSMLRSSTE